MKYVVLTKNFDFITLSDNFFLHHIIYNQYCFSEKSVLEMYEQNMLTTPNDISCAILKLKLGGFDSLDMDDLIAISKMIRDYHLNDVN